MNYYSKFMKSAWPERVCYKRQENVMSKSLDAGIKLESPVHNIWSKVLNLSRSQFSHL